MKNPRNIKRQKETVTKVKETELKENKCLSDAQEHTNIRLVKMTKTALDLRTEFHQEIEILMRTQAKMKNQ